MKILVCFKVTRDTERLTPSELEALCDGTGDLRLAQKNVDTHDEAALEAAIRLRDMAREEGTSTDGVELYALTVGGCEKRFTDQLLALGYDEVVDVPSDEDLTFQPELVAAAICRYVDASDGFGAVLLGQQSSVGANAQTPYIVATRLGVPCLSNVVDLQYTRGSLTVTAQTDSGFCSGVVDCPAVYAIGNAVHPYLRMATLKERLAVAGRESVRFVPGEIAPEMGRAHLQRLTFTRVTRTCAFVPGETIQEQVCRLREMLVSAAGGL